MEQKKIAILYDFDQTLSIKSMEEYGLFDYLEIEPQALYDRVTVRAAEYEMDRVLAFMLELVVRAKEVNKPLTKKVLVDSGANIEYFPGVLSWFERINQFGKEHGIEVEHYLVSSARFLLHRYARQGCTLRNAALLYRDPESYILKYRRRGGEAFCQGRQL